MNAYDIEIVNDAAHAGEANHGWCFGLPPGIRPEQWPLDPDTGYPLMHGSPCCCRRTTGCMARRSSR